MKAFRLLALVALVSACGQRTAPATTPSATVPLDGKSPWPKFRANAAQDGRSAAKRTLGEGQPWSYRTGKGIFSSPVIAGDGTIYIGSADKKLYALTAEGKLRFEVVTDEIVDSSALLDDKGRVYFGSGDGKLRALDARDGRVIWTMTADEPSVNKAFINWFEGNVAIGPDGTLYVPNDNFFLYAIDRDTGSVKWRRKMPDQTWSLPAVDAATGTLFVGNNNLLPALGRNTFALDPKGEALWDASTLGSIAASPMFTPEGLLVVGGFDGWVRAYDAKSGDERWAFATRDHVYASPGRLSDGTIVQPSCDGTVYGLDPKSGAVRWTYDAGEPIRSSPAIDEVDNVYLGTGDGRLLVLGPDGRERWSMRLIDEARNDLNASPALGRSAIVLAGESGEIFSVPFDWCLRAEASGDARCKVGTVVRPVVEGATLRWTTAHGALLDVPPATHPANRPVALSLELRQGGTARLATLDAKSLDVQVEPKVDVSVDLSGDGHFVVITPTKAFVAGEGGKTTLTIGAKVLVDHDRDGLRLKGGKPGVDVRASVSFAIPAEAPSSPLAIPKVSGDPATTWALARLALPLPTLLPSYNQIGFDSLHYVIGIVEGDAHAGIAWMAGGRIATDGRVSVDPATKALMPLVYAYDQGRLTLRNEDGLSVEVMNAVIPFRTFRIATTLDASLGAMGEATMSGSTLCAKVPFYGPFLQTLGLCNPQTDVLGVLGATRLTPIDAKAPSAIGTVTFVREADAIVANIEGSTLAEGAHVASMLLVDATTNLPVTLDYGLITTRNIVGGKITSVRLPTKGHTLPAKLRAHLLADTHPVATTTL